MKITSKDQLEPGDRIRVSFEAKVNTFDAYDQCTQVHHTYGDGENTYWSSYLYFNDDFEDIGLTVEKLVSTPELKTGQVWEDPGPGRRFSVYLDSVTGTSKVVSLDDGATFTSLSFHTLFPNAELILDA